LKYPGRQLLVVVSVFIGICLVPLRSVHAYVDPGTGSYLLQLLVATLFGALFAIKVFWARIKRLANKVTVGSLRHKQDPGGK